MSYSSSTWLPLCAGCNLRYSPQPNRCPTECAKNDLPIPTAPYCAGKYRMALLRRCCVPSVGAAICWDSTQPIRGRVDYGDSSPGVKWFASTSGLPKPGVLRPIFRHGRFSLIAIRPAVLPDQCPCMLWDTLPFDPKGTSPMQPGQVQNPVACCRDPNK